MPEELRNPNGIRYRPLEIDYCDAEMQNMEVGDLPRGIPAGFVSQMLGADSVKAARLILARWLPGIVEVDRVVIITPAGPELRRSLLKSGLVTEVQPALNALAAVSGYAIRERGSVRVASTAQQRGDDCAALSAAGLRSSMHIPVMGNNHVYGAIELAHHRPGFFTETHVELLEAAAALLGAIHQLHAPLTDRAGSGVEHDHRATGAAPLLGLGNNRSLLRAALQQGEIGAQFQPVFRYSGHELISIEGLARWRSDQDMRSASQFLPGAPTMTEKVTRRVADRVTDMIRELNIHDIATPQFAVNVAGADLSTMVDWWNQQELPSGSLSFEVPMVDAFDNHDEIAKVMLRGQAAGLHFVLDDVCEHTASSVNPFALPIEGMKIAMALTHSITVDQAAHNYAERLVNMARRRGLYVSAKGVETMEQAEQLRALGINRMQGYYFLPPVSRGQLLTYIAPRSALAATA